MESLGDGWDLYTHFLGRAKLFTVFPTKYLVEKSFTAVVGYWKNNETKCKCLRRFETPFYRLQTIYIIKLIEANEMYGYQ